MRIYSRREGEGLVIHDDIHVTVLKIQQTEVRLAISSPREIPSYREETLCWEPAERSAQLQYQF
jgi:carbon storage regulator CsrA